MIQLPFPSTIEAQPRNITFKNIKTVVRKIQENYGQTGSCAWTRQCLEGASKQCFSWGGGGFKGGGGCTRFQVSKTAC